MLGSPRSGSPTSRATAAIFSWIWAAVTPVAEPDGRDRYVDWYYAYKIDETGEGASFGGPRRWKKRPEYWALIPPPSIANEKR